VADFFSDNGDEQHWVGEVPAEFGERADLPIGVRAALLEIRKSVHYRFEQLVGGFLVELWAYLVENSLDVVN